MRKAIFVIGFALAFALVAAAQDIPSGKGPSVTMAPPGVPSVAAGDSGTVSLNFRVSPGFHINSNTPHAEYLIATTLKMEPPTDIVIGKVTYPAGKDMSFPFSPDEKLSVYTGDFTVEVKVRPLHTVVPGKYAMRGKLRYQACDNAQCYPPKQLPIDFDVKIVKAKAAPKANPAQSPHVHG
jgi:Disulphide bond corrector protein DsbC